MREVTLEELLSAGAHFGHQVTRANPKARDFVYEAREGVQIIDLAKTKEGLDEAIDFVKSQARAGKTILVVGTKRQARDVVLKSLENLKDKNVLYITNHWVGGLLTNFSEVSKNIKKFHDLTAKLASEEEKANYTKKEIGLWEKERQRLESLYGGVTSMTKLPDLLYIIDSHLEDLAVKEGRSMGVPMVAIVDTNADPNEVDYAIPANDDAVGSIELITSFILGTWGENFREESEEKEEPKVAEEKKENPAKKVETKTKKETKKKVAKKKNAKS